MQQMSVHLYAFNQETSINTKFIIIRSTDFVFTNNEMPFNLYKAFESIAAG